MRRAILLLVAAGATLMLVAGVALAEAVTCDSAPPCYGTPEGDEITASPNGETIYALGGDDSVAAGEGDDTVYGAAGADGTLWGEGGSDTVYGGGGGDEIEADHNDTAGSTDYSYGGRGNDSIYAADGNVDIINCGKGSEDLAQYDVARDRVEGCETKQPL